MHSAAYTCDISRDHCKNINSKLIGITYVFDLDDVLLPTSALFSRPHTRQWIEAHARTNVISHAIGGYQQVIRPDLKLVQQLQNLNGSKYILTNASRTHAHASLNALGIAECFVGQIDATHNLHLKPHREPYEHMHRFAHSVPRSTTLTDRQSVIFFDDRIENHKEPKGLGWTTVWIYGASGGFGLCDHTQSTRQVPEYVDMTFATLHDALDYFVATQNIQPNLLPVTY